MANGVLQGIMNPAVGQPVAGFRRGQVDRFAGDILSKTIGAEIGGTADLLAKVDPQTAAGLFKSFGIPVGQTARMNKMVGDILGGTEILRTAGPQAAAQFLSEGAAFNESVGIRSPLYAEYIEGIAAGDPQRIEEFMTLGNAFKSIAKDADASKVQSSKILPDGTIITVMSDRETIVTDPEGNVVEGEARAAAIRAGEDRGIEIQTGRARGRTEATEEEKRASDLIEQGTLAAESTAGLRRGIELLNSIETGGVDAVRLRARNLFGIETADEGELTNELATAVLSQLRDTFGAQFTEREGERLERIEAGIGKSTAANRRLLNQALGIAERKARRAIKAARRRDQIDVVDDIQGLLDFRITDPEGEETGTAVITPQGVATEQTIQTPTFKAGRFDVEVVNP